MKQDENPFRYCSEPIAGVDLSLRSPAIVIVPPTDQESFILPFSICKGFYLTNRKSYAFTKGNLRGSLFGHFESREGQYETISEQLIDILLENKVKHIALEDYSYGSPNTMVLTQLAENAGIFKYFLHKHGISYDLYSPSSIKKCATGQGIRADKSKMRDAFYEDNPDYDIQSQFDRKRTDKPNSPVNDLIDAYYLALSGRVANAVQSRENI